MIDCRCYIDDPQSNFRTGFRYHRNTRGGRGRSGAAQRGAAWRGEIGDVRNRSYEPDIVRSGAKRCRPRIEGFLWRAKNNDCTRINSVRIDTRARHWDRNLHAFTTMKYNGARGASCNTIARRGKGGKKWEEGKNQQSDWAVTLKACNVFRSIIFQK